MFAETISPEILQLTLERATFAKHRREIAEAVASIGDRITSSREVIAASHAIIAKADRLLDTTCVPASMHCRRRQSVAIGGVTTDERSSAAASVRLRAG